MSLRREMNMTYKLLFALLLGIVLCSAPLAFAGDGDDQGEDDNDQGGIVIMCPPGGCIQ